MRAASILTYYCRPPRWSARRAGAIDSWGVMVSKHSTFRYNRAQYGGAVSCCKGDRGGGGEHNISHSRFQYNTAVEDGGGAVFVLKGAMRLEKVTVVGNSAVGAGGAILGEGGSLDARETVFDANVASSGGHAVSVTGVQHWLLQSSDITPFDAKSSVEYFSSPPPTCNSNPCYTGMGCLYSRFSRTCAPCPNNTASLTGQRCSPCERGLVPTSDKRACKGCEDGKYSPFGVKCESCEGLRSYSNNNTKEVIKVQQNGATIRLRGHRSCLKCELPTVANENRTNCVCPANYYSLSGPSWKDTECYSCVFANTQLGLSCPGGPVGSAPILAKKGVFIDANTLMEISADWHACMKRAAANARTVSQITGCGQFLDSRPSAGDKLYHCDPKLCVGTRQITARSEITNGRRRMQAARSDFACIGAQALDGELIQNCCGNGVEHGSVLCGICTSNFGKVENKGCIPCLGYNWLYIFLYIIAYAAFAYHCWNKQTSETNLIGIMTTFLQ